MKLKSPLFPKDFLRPVLLADGLKAYVCDKSGGHWISNEDYQAWLKDHGETMPEKTDCEVDLEFQDAKQAKICPECGRILIKYNVGHGLPFFVDHCPGCGGVWLDKNEWEALREKNLHDEIHKIFSSHWQSGIRQDELRIKFATIYEKRFGREGYQNVKHFREWLVTHPQRAEILAYLEAKDPYRL